MSGPNPFRVDPEACTIARQGAAERRRRAALCSARAFRPNDSAERRAVQDAAARYAAAHGAYELHGRLCLEAARYAPEVGSPAGQARSEAERLFSGGGER